MYLQRQWLMYIDSIMEISNLSRELFASDSMLGSLVVWFSVMQVQLIEAVAVRERASSDEHSRLGFWVWYPEHDSVTRVH